MKLYVSNLSFHTTDDDLRKMFEEFGPVSSSKVITDRETGRSRGFAFVEMESESDANRAISGMNGQDVKGRTMSVSQAREREPRSDNRRY